MVSYFAYGSNLNQEDLNKWCRQRNRPLIDLKSKSPRTCILRDYRLDFNYYSPSRGGGAANIEPSLGEHVEGVLSKCPALICILLTLRKAPRTSMP